ncbi:MAG TPA: hypothetical protein VG294_14575 [Solirubrobacteraceae bacterium]|nr:hypothetical protein [Solirubrobacteraceae bacterium]
MIVLVIAADAAAIVLLTVFLVRAQASSPALPRRRGLAPTASPASR